MRPTIVLCVWLLPRYQTMYLNTIITIGNVLCQVWLWKRRTQLKKGGGVLRRIQDRRTGRAPPLLKNFDCITRIYFNCSQHAMFIICNLFPILTTKTYGIYSNSYYKTVPPSGNVEKGDNVHIFWPPETPPPQKKKTKKKTPIKQNKKNRLERHVQKEDLARGVSVASLGRGGWLSTKLGDSGIGWESSSRNTYNYPQNLLEKSPAFLSAEERS